MPERARPRDVAAGPVVLGEPDRTLAQIERARPVALGLGPELLEARGHPLRVTVQPEVDSARERGDEPRVERIERHDVVERHAGGQRERAEGLQIGEDRRSEIHQGPAGLDPTGHAAGLAAGLDDRHAVTPRTERSGRRQPGKAGADHDDAAHALRPADRSSARAMEPRARRRCRGSHAAPSRAVARKRSTVSGPPAR